MPLKRITVVFSLRNSFVLPHLGRWNVHVAAFWQDNLVVDDVPEEVIVVVLACSIPMKPDKAVSVLALAWY
jgi:hypothetical protein